MVLWKLVLCEPCVRGQLAWSAGLLASHVLAHLLINVEMQFEGPILQSCMQSIQQQHT